jgi:putative Ig domain-containing protein
LNATANVPGSFAYSPAAGTVLSAGSGQLLSVVFTPADSVDYTSASASVRINVIAVTPPPAVNPIVPIPDQFNSEGDRVRLKVQIDSSDTPLIGTNHNEDNDGDDCQARGVFNAMNLPPGLEIERKHGVIRGRIGLYAAGDYHVTVSFTINGVTFKRSFTWHVADALKRHRHDERDSRHYQ